MTTIAPTPKIIHSMIPPKSTLYLAAYGQQQSISLLRLTRSAEDHSDRQGIP